MASRKAVGGAGFDADEIDEGRGVADIDGFDGADQHDDAPIDEDFAASRAVTTMEFDVGDIEFDAVARVELAQEARKAAKKRSKGATGAAAAAAPTAGGVAIAADELSVAVLGHVDSGKSTIIGHTLALCGLVGRRELHLNAVNSESAGKGSFAHAWAMDRGEEERERGITIDVSITRIIAGDSVQRSAPGYGSTAEEASAAAGLGSACPATKSSGASSLLPMLNRPLCILDAPGHGSLVSGAITAAAHADVALLVLPATAGEFETAVAGGGTAREHCIAARSLGLSRIVVAVNKMDTVGWSQERFEVIKAATAQLLCAELKSSPNHVVFVPLCGISGVNVVTTVAEAAAEEAALAEGEDADDKTGLGTAARWYSVESMLLPGAKLSSTGLVGLAGTSSVSGSAGRGLTLLETLRCVRPCLPKDIQEAVKPLRLCVSDVFANDATGIGGTVVVGRVAAGWVQPRMVVAAAPGVVGGKGASVRMVRCAGSVDAEDRDVVYAGQTVELVLGGVPEDMILRAGSVLTWPSHPIPVATEAKCRISMMPAGVIGLESASAGSSGMGAAAAAAASSAGGRGTSGGSAGGGWDDAGASGGAYRVPPLLPIATGSRLRMHGMSVDTACTVTCILALLDKDDAVVKHRPRVLKQGQRAIVRVRFESPVPIEAVKHQKRIGRFLLRQGSRSAATGTILRVYK